MAESGPRVGDSIVEPLIAPADVNLADTSDALIDELSGFRDAMTGPLGQLYQRWSGHPSRGQDWSAIQPPYGQGGQELDLLQQLRGFGFGHIWGAGGRAANLGSAAALAQQVQVEVQQKLTEAWSGVAADAAAEKLEDLNKALYDYSGYVGGFSEALRQLWSTVRQPILDVVNVPNIGSARDFLIHHNPEDCAGQNMFIDRLDDAIRWGREWGGGEYLGVVGGGSSEVADNAETGTGPIAPQDIRGMSIDLDRGYSSKWSDMFCREMDEFALGYANAMNQYRSAIEAAFDAAQAALRAFADLLNVPTNPFGTLLFGPVHTSGVAGPAQVGGPGPSPQIATATGGTAPTPAAAGGPPPGAPAPAPPPVAASDPQVPDETTPSGSNPLAGAPLGAPEIDTPHPVEPGIRAQALDGTEPDTITVSSGDHEISLTAPGHDGMMTITIDDGAGSIQNYVLDFQDQGAAVPTDAELPDQPEASASGTGTEPRHTPGPDGKIHVEDGDTHITAEQPDGPDGATVVVVDDGNGDPATYTLDGERSESGTPQATPAAGAPADSSPSFAGGDERGTLHPAPSTGQDAEATQATSPQTVSGLDAVSNGAASSGHGIGAGLPPADSPEDGANIGSADSRPAPQGAGLASAPGGLSAVAAGSGQDTDMSAGGMGMMGGGTGAAGGGADQERSSSAYPVHGNVFDIGASGSRISGTLDIDDESSGS